MKLLVALCTILTFQLCLIGASELEEHDIEDLDMEMEEDQDMEMEDDYIDSNAMEPRQEPRHKWHRCERNRRRGWGGRCLDWTQLLNQSCDYMWSGNDEIHGERLCHDPALYCCVDCLDTTSKCPKGTNANRQCCSFQCPDARLYNKLDSGCDCCTKCIPNSKYCNEKKDGSICVTKNDPNLNFDNCILNGGTLNDRRCGGKGCQCCVRPTNPAGLCGINWLILK